MEMMNNAIEHANAEHISCYVKKDALYTEISITDDGIGMQSDRLMRFRESIMSDEISGKHIGMRNVHRRIQLHFGEAYGLKIDSEWQKGTTVTILLPVEEVDQAKEVTEDENRNCR